MKAAVVSLGSVSSQWIIEAMKKYFEVVDDISLKGIEVNFGADHPQILYKGEPLAHYDCIYVKGSFRYHLILRAITSAVANDKTYVPIEAPAFTVGHDKLLTQLELQLCNIPTPKTYLASTTDAAKGILENINYPVIIKRPDGTQGKGVMFADSFASANSMLDALSAMRHPFLIQEYIETGGEDIRMIVAGDKVLASMKRKSAQGEKRANMHTGAVGETYIPDSYHKKVAIEAAKALNVDVCGVDMIESAKGPLVLEINLSPGLQGITKVTKIDVADKMAKYFFEKTKEMVDSDKKASTDSILKETGISDKKINEVIMNPKFRGTTMIIPEMITNVTKFNEKDELIYKVERGKLVISKQESSSE